MNTYAKNRRKNLYFGSVKTNIGHTEVGAGLAGLIKIVMQLNTKQIPKIYGLKDGNINPLISNQINDMTIFPTKNINVKDVRL